MPKQTTIRSDLLSALYDRIRTDYESKPEWPGLRDPARKEKIELIQKKEQERDQYFWEEVRKIYPPSYIPDDVWARIRHKAWEDGHSAGYFEVLGEITELVYLVKGDS